MGLLLLRVAVGSTTVIQGGAYLTGGNLSLWPCFAGVVAIVSGASFIAGFLTRLASSVVALSAIEMFSRFPPSPLNLFEAVPSTFLVVVVAVAVIFLGPGAWSIDARLFGRREIVIPRTSRCP
jgi:uncharacterized membrane protein YphA (DoxX/SURF4 family)